MSVLHGAHAIRVAVRYALCHGGANFAKISIYFTIFMII